MQTVFWAIIALGLLIFVHELGHFLVARLMGVRVLVFSLGFGPTLWSRVGESGTEYRIASVPLGGYVKMLGEGDDETPLTDENLSYSFSHKSVGARSAIIFAGPLGNFLFALVAMIVIHLNGVDIIPPVIGKLSTDMPAIQAGVQVGDRIVAIDGHPVERWETLKELISNAQNDMLQLTITRDGKELEIALRPVVKELPNIFGEPTRMSVIGISPARETERIVFPPWQAVVEGSIATWRIMDLTVQGIWKLLTRVVPADQIGGPILIAEMAGKAAEVGATSFLYFLAFVSINLGILNLLPIPVLDGGHLLFNIIEIVKGSPADAKTRDYAIRVGIALMLGLMTFALYNDLFRLLSDK
ncbi:MAG: RIP metalloprotease RseP [Magnetococcales bacterium]|nr:RIP metalloprotease RseP [Magnetococcales bacterium]NGZ25681.1 RIP metalloprotease RseP [Magnetococcales bacterium]